MNQILKLAIATIKIRSNDFYVKPDVTTLKPKPFYQTLNDEHNKKNHRK